MDDSQIEDVLLFKYFREITKTDQARIYGICDEIKEDVAKEAESQKSSILNAKIFVITLDTLKRWIDTHDSIDFQLNLISYLIERIFFQKFNGKAQKTRVLLEMCGTAELPDKIVPQNLGRLVRFTGLVCRVSPAKPFAEEFVFQCEKCSVLKKIPNVEDKYQNIHICKCKRPCFKLNDSSIDLRDVQLLKIKNEHVDEYFNIQLWDDHINVANPGDKIYGIGIVRMSGDRNGCYLPFVDVINFSNSEKKVKALEKYKTAETIDPAANTVIKITRKRLDHDKNIDSTLYSGRCDNTSILLDVKSSPSQLKKISLKNLKPTFQSENFNKTSHFSTEPQFEQWNSLKGKNTMPENPYIKFTHLNSNCTAYLTNDLKSHQNSTDKNYTNVSMNIEPLNLDQKNALFGQDSTKITFDDDLAKNMPKEKCKPTFDHTIATNLSNKNPDAGNLNDGVCYGESKSSQKFPESESKMLGVENSDIHQHKILRNTSTLQKPVVKTTKSIYSQFKKPALKLLYCLKNDLPSKPGEPAANTISDADFPIIAVNVTKSIRNKRLLCRNDYSTRSNSCDSDSFFDFSFSQDAQKQPSHSTFKESVEFSAINLMHKNLSASEDSGCSNINLKKSHHDFHTFNHMVTNLREKQLISQNFKSIVENNNHPRIPETFHSSTTNPSYAKHDNNQKSFFSPGFSDDYKVFIKISRDPNLFDHLKNAVYPNIYGHEDIKTAGLLSLVMPCKQHDQIGLNVLLIGDPGLGKSQILLSTAKALKKSVYVTANNTTTAGLTISLTTDPLNGDVCIEAGAFVLADNGICFIDEFDKMQDFRSLFEILDDGNMCYNKGGIYYSLKVHCSLLCATNPRNGHFDKTKGLKENVIFDDRLLDRFDLIYVMIEDYTNLALKNILDVKSNKKDMIKLSDLNKKVTNSTENKKGHDSDPCIQNLQAKENLDSNFPNGTNLNHSKACVYSLPVLLSYIFYCKENIHPVLSKKAKNVIKDFFAQSRNTNKTTSRLTTTLIKLTIAFAKIQLKGIATEEEADMAINQFEKSIFDFQHNQDSYVDILQKNNRQIFTKPDLIELLGTSKYNGDINKLLEKLHNEGLLIQTATNVFKIEFRS